MMEIQEAETTKKQWFKINVRPGHMGAGKISDKCMVVYAHDPMEALKLANKRGGWHKKSKKPFRIFHPSQLKM